MWLGVIYSAGQNIFFVGLLKAFNVIPDARRQRNGSDRILRFRFGDNNLSFTLGVFIKIGDSLNRAADIYTLFAWLYLL